MGENFPNQKNVLAQLVSEKSIALPSIGKTEASYPASQISLSKERMLNHADTLDRISPPPWRWNSNRGALRKPDTRCKERGIQAPLPMASMTPWAMTTTTTMLPPIIALTSDITAIHTTWVRIGTEVISKTWVTTSSPHQTGLLNKLIT